MPTHGCLMAIVTAAAARTWMLGLPGVSRETIDRLEDYAALLRAENGRQNLVAANTLDEDILWTRHFLDSAQLLHFAPTMGGRWIDVGSGAGLPGLVVAILAPNWKVTLVDNRKRRCAFLRETAMALNLEISVEEMNVERLPAGNYDVISARAYAPLPKILSTSRHLAHESTVWLLPKGRNAANALSTLPSGWQKRFHVEPSLTDDEARILIGHGAMSG
jgi:16S rRNA (guanine527-N7)-methyltransferase